MKKFILLSVSLLLISLSSGAAAANTDEDIQHCINVTGFAEIVVKHRAKDVSRPDMNDIIFKRGGGGGLTTTNMYAIVKLIFDNDIGVRDILEICLNARAKAGATTNQMPKAKV